MGLDELRVLLTDALSCLETATLPETIEVLERYRGDPWKRLGAVRTPATPWPRCRLRSEGPSALGREAGRLVNRWWDVVTDPKHVQIELEAIQEVWELEVIEEVKETTEPPEA